MFNAQDYLKKIELSQERPSLAFLEALQKKHLELFCFSNAEVLLKSGELLPLDRDSLYKKIVTKRIGGYCFEHNKLFCELLIELGFNAKISIARVLNNKIEMDAPRTHRVTIVHFEGRDYLVDVGFGMNCLTKPLLIENGFSLEIGSRKAHIDLNQYGEFSFSYSDRNYPNGYVLYSFNLERYSEADCLVGHFFSHHYPEAVFVRNFVLTKIADEKRYSLVNFGLRRYVDGEEENSTLSTFDEFKDCVTSFFGLNLSDEELKKLYRHIENSISL
ncbi:arylamine N-acetyltransferase [Halobacteriovorax sp. GB3]|uniref:arylamine N-acetyltransferase family protein n=1 Tax=Halobacteriovorax sp. GB3 TaxID=2719615 RepID=UPI0023610ADC|nr:arylamine N-acetyltransferase [Halobacteriovorax sp. GB3]MDD0853605.1 arylamine N-acetyltransferase [Halobacteriovorax sp. GB3]